MAFIDFKKAFDTVRHSRLWNVLMEMGVNDTTCKVLKSLYNELQAAIRVEKQTSEWFAIRKGVRQGCLISSMLFNFYSEEIMRRSVDELDSIGVNINGRNVNNFRCYRCLWKRWTERQVRHSWRSIRERQK